ncbi:MAG: phenylacetic acid degradation bifunctional protein PaaZ, partial [Proteobacteria bacterium]|nr:phenylacetic acid degradation bifunctional protein PaaZ [Pseudomonadota bacterium]
MRELQSYLQGGWVTGAGDTVILPHAVTGTPFASLRPSGLDTKGALLYARAVGGPALRKLTFHARARLLKQMAIYLMERKDQFYAISAATGATKADSWIDIEGGIGTFYVTSSKGRRELPDDFVFAEGHTELISKGGTFVGRHICVPLEGAAIHINAFNFPCWGMLEKVASSFLAGMPSIVKPASATSYLAEAMVREMIASRIFPEGSLQLVCGSVGDLFEHLTCQDVVTFTGSAETGRKLKSHPKIVTESIRFNLEADSLNCSVLGADARPGSEEFDLFIKEVAREMTVKAGQKCTAIRRTIVPDDMVGDVIGALKKRLSTVVVGDPCVEGVRMGPLVGKAQVAEVGGCVERLKKSAELVLGGFDSFAVTGASTEAGAFFPISLLHCPNPLSAADPHSIEAFGPVNTVMGYKSTDEAIELARMGRGSLVGSLFTADEKTARDITIGLAPYHGRIVVINRSSAKESTGHGSPLPHLVHGGPGRAGGGEEMGGIRGVLHYMQRTAVQGSPQTLTAVSHEWTRGSDQLPANKHPFQKFFDEL